MSVDLLNTLTSTVDEAIEVGGIDHNLESEGGGFTRTILETGVYPMYLCQYIEVGTQKFNGYQGAKDTFSKGFIWGMAVFNFDNVDEDGNPEVVIIGSGFPQKLSQDPKAGFFKLFKALNYNNDTTKKHIVKFMGAQHSYQGKVLKKKTTSGKEYNAIDPSSLTPFFEGLGAKKTRYVLPEVDAKDVSVLLWDAPNQAQWDSLQRGADTVSAGDPKNFIKYTVLQATDFDGSALDIMLREAGVDTTVKPKESKEVVKEPDEFDADVPFETEEEAPKEPKKKPMPKSMPAMPEEE